MRGAALAAAIVLGFGAGLVPGAAQAQSDAEDIVAELTSDGFEVIEIRKTLLGRLRFRSRRGDVTREIVLNPSSGAILRDYSSRPDAEPAGGDDHRFGRGGPPPGGVGDRPPPGDRPPGGKAPPDGMR